MKKRILSLFIVLFVSLWIQPVFAQKTERIETSSLLKFKTIDNPQIFQAFEKGKAMLLIYFRTDCDDCNRNLRLLEKVANRYPVQFWLVSAEAVPKLQVCEDMYGLYNIDNVIVLQDYSKSMHTWFDFRWLPFVVLYDANGNEIKRFDKLPSPEDVTKLLK